MPPLSRNLVRLALCYLVAGIVLGALLLAEKGLAFAPRLWALLPIHIEFLFFGWMVQLVFGVASWILPRTAAHTRPRALILAALLLNAGIALVCAGALWPGGSMAPGRGLEIGAVAAFAFHLWPRVRPFVRHVH